MSVRAYCLAGLAVFLLIVVGPEASAVLPPFGNAEGKPDAPSTMKGCTVLRWDRESTVFPKMFVREPGKYCLDRDYTADLRGCLHGCRGEFISIRANDVELDLRTHFTRHLEAE